jgi:hypothetical protein
MLAAAGRMMIKNSICCLIAAIIDSNGKDVIVLATSNFLIAPIFFPSVLKIAEGEGG